MFILEAAHPTAIHSLGPPFKVEMVKPGHRLFVSGGLEEGRFSHLRDMFSRDVVWVDTWDWHNIFVGDRCREYIIDPAH